ncbi:MAG: diaminopimelate epimerase [Alphaproteobacteria bacterium]
MSELDFHKMHGLGNDFVIVDQRSGKLVLSAAQIRKIADRRRGVGFDQLLLLQPSDKAHVFMRVYNPDGSESGACGNGTRCVARLMMEEQGLSSVLIETRAGILEAKPGLMGYSVVMGRPGLAWDEIPLARAMDTLHLDIEAGPLKAPTAVNMGNPHAVFFVGDAEAVDLAALGPGLEHHPLFPERANIGVAQVRDRNTIRLRVFERGAGITSACGSGACAAVVAAIRRDLVGPTASVLLDGGKLSITWREDGQVVMTGPASHSFTGSFQPEMLAVDNQAAAKDQAKAS